MKLAAWITGTALVLVLALFALQFAASERIEVVVLHSTAPGGDDMTTRLWLVDHAGKQYLRVGQDGSGWFDSLIADPEVRVTRNEITRAYLAVPRPELSETVNNLMNEKYTWGDTLIGYLFGSRENSIPIELAPR